MNKAVKVMFINLAACALLATLSLMGGGSNLSNDFLILFGLICLAVAVLDLFVAIILFIVGQQYHDVAKGFLLSCGVLVLTGFAACSFTTLSFH